MKPEKFRQLSPQAILTAVFVLSLLSFLLAALFPSRFYMTLDIASYLVFHNIAEFFSVIVSLSIFGLGWFTYEQSKNRHALFLSCVFLAIGSIDFMHTLGYSGMPDFITPNSVSKSTQFWIEVRLFSAVSFLYSAFIYPDTQKRWLSKQILLSSALAITAFTFVSVTYYPSYLPATFIEGSGLTAFKIYSEYLTIGLFALAFAGYWRHFSKTGDRLLLYYLSAFVISIFSELAFTLYKSAFDTYNMLGHIYKIIAFYLIYRGIFISSVKHPYVRLMNTGEELKEEIAVRRQAEKVLQRNKQVLQLFIEHAPAAIAMLDRDMKYIAASRRFLADYDLGEQNLVGRSHYEVFPEIPERWKEIHRRCLAGALERSDEDPFPRADGRLDWVRWEIFPWNEYTGEIGGIILFSEVITERKQAEVALRESETRYSSLFENIIEGFAYCRMIFENNKPQDFIYLDVNKSFEELTGLKNIIGKKVTEVIPGIQESNPELFEIYGRVALTGKPERFEIYLDALKIWFSISVYSPAKEHFVAVFDNITERKRIEKALQKSEEYFRSLIENASDVITIINSGGIIEYESSPIEKILGYKPEELIGSNAFEFIYPEDREKVIKTFTQGIQNVGTTYSIEYRFQHKDGSWRILESVGKGFLTDSGEVNVIVNSRDITEQKRLEEQFLQAQKMEAVGRLAGGVAHDFNNMLTAIQGYSELLVEKFSQEDPRLNYVNEISKASERAALLTRQLLAFSRRQIFQPKVINLNTLVDGMKGMLKRLIGEDIELVIIPQETLGQVKADPGQIEQVIMNLVVNSRDAMTGDGKIIIETMNVEFNELYSHTHIFVQPGSYLMLAVSDTGCGMDAETQKYIFEPFFTTKETGKGTGLGLSTVYGIVKQSGGYIFAYSELNKGTTFKIYLPRVDEAAQSFEQGAAISSELLSGSETILLVEDDDTLRSLSTEILRLSGYTVLEASDGAEALLVFEKHNAPIHLLLTDVVMPKMNGRDLAERLTLLRPEIKVLYMSGYTDRVLVQTGGFESEISILQKPFLPSVLTRRVREVLDAP